jgi:hypothetical protein
VRDLIKELSTILVPLDGRWKTFGLNMPGAKHIPAVPTGLIVRIIGTDALVQWDAAERAEYYRVFKRVVGIDEELVPVSSQNGLDAVVPGLPANTSRSGNQAALCFSGVWKLDAWSFCKWLNHASTANPRRIINIRCKYNTGVFAGIVNVAAGQMIACGDLNRNGHSRVFRGREGQLKWRAGRTRASATAIRAW